MEYFDRVVYALKKQGLCTSAVILIPGLRLGTPAESLPCLCRAKLALSLPKGQPKGFALSPWMDADKRGFRKTEQEGKNG